jgi:hypothetical protein
MSGISLLNNEVAGTHGGSGVYVAPGLLACDLRLQPPSGRNLAQP